MKEEVKHRMMQQIELTLLKLHHVPFIVSKRQKMAVWSDIREVLFMKCTHPRCSVVLSALKSHLRYPTSEKFMHPCSLSEQLQFMKKFMVVSPGTLLVDLNSIGDRFELMKLYDMVKIKHDTSPDVTIKRCREMSERKKYDKHAHYYSDNPLRNLTKKIFLPSIQRKSNKDYCEQRDGRLIQSVLYNSYGEEASSALIPMYLLKETYPASVGILEEAVRLFIIGQSEQSSLASVGQCTRDEGYHFSRFMAMQFGFEKQWPCFTSSSLLISWEEFWLTNSRNTDVNIVPNINVSVVTLNCQVKEGTRQNIQPANHNSKTSSKQPCIMNAQAVKMEKTLENEMVKLKETEMGILNSKGNIRTSQMSLIEKHMSLSNEKDLLLHQEATRESTKPGPCSLKKSKSYTLSLPKSLKIKLNSPRLSNSYNMLPDINAAKVSQNAGTDENNSDKSKGEIEERVTRSKSYNTVRTNKHENGSIKTDKDKICTKKIKGINPDSNNSAVLDAVSKKKVTGNASGHHLDSDKKYAEAHQDLSVSRESVTAGQATFDMGSFDVSITPKKKQIEACVGEQKDDTKPKLREVEGRTSPSKRYNDRKNLKISSAKFSDNIPDLLRVGKKVANVDNNLYEKQRALGSKGIAVPDTNINNLTESVDNKDGGIATKSIELSVVSPKANTKGKDFIACKTKPLKQAKKKGALIDDDTYPMVSGVKLQNSPTKVRDRPTCKSAGTLPGPLNTIPIKPMSATLDRTGKLPTEIVSNLKKQATNSICSVLGNSDAKTLKDIVASGKEIISPRKNETKTSADFSDFQTERIIMWRDNLENDSSLESSRACKSADTSGRKERPYTYRPSSSIYYPSYSDQKTGFGPSIKTGLCILMSRDRNKSSKLSSIKNTYQVPKRQISPKKTKEIKSASIEVDTTNYGSSSSKSPDIYDEFARKKKPNKGAKPDMQIVKGKQMSCEQKYVQNIPLYKMKYLDGRNKPLENNQETVTQADNISMAGSRKQHKLFEYSPPEILDSTNKSVPLHQYQSKASNETRNLPVSSNLYRIMDANLAKRNNLYQCSQDELGNESNSNQYTSCSMCWHESHLADGSEISQHDDNAILTELKMSPSSLSNAMTKEPRIFTTQDENIRESKHTLADLGQNHFESHESILERLNRMDEEAQSCSDDQDKNSDLEDIDTSRRIKLLDKMNMFVDGISDPHESGSLENIENIKSIIKINPIVSQNQLSARLMEQHLLNESLQIHVQKGQEIPNVMIKDRRDTEGDENITGRCVNQVSDGQVLVDYGAETCYTEVFSNDTESDSKGDIHFSEKHGNYAKFEYDLDMSDQIELIDNTSRQSPGEKIIDNFSDKYTTNKEYQDESSNGLKENSHTANVETVNSQGKSREKKRRKNKHINTESKSFKEVVEEKRASKKKAELELTKKKFWKSANPCYQETEGQKYESNPSPKKIIIKTLSEDNAGIQRQQKPVTKFDKKKRPKTCPTNKAKTHERDAAKDNLSKIYTSNGKKKSKVKEYKNSVSDSEQMKSGSKKLNLRVLRSNTVKSAKSERSCRRKKRSPVKIPTEDMIAYEEDVTHNVIENTKNTNQGPVESKKFKARQRKLRLKVHNNCNPQKSKSAIEDDVPHSESAEASFEEVDDSNIICETVHAENILEIPDDQSEDHIDSSGTITFITQTPDLPFQQDTSNVNSSLFGEMTNQDYMSYLQTDREDYSFPASDVLKTNADSESANNEANSNGFSFENNLLTYNDGLKVGSGDLNFYHSQEGDSMKNIDLSELPESVLEVVLSDNLINMATMPSPHTDGVEGKGVSLINGGGIDGLQQIARTTNDNANIGARDVYLHNQDQFTEDELHYFNQLYKEIGDSTTQSSSSTIVSQENAPEDIHLPLDQAISEDVSQNAITVLHPNGGKIILPRNHPAFEIFTNVFVQNFGYPEEGQHVSSQEEICSEFTDLTHAPGMANENEIQEDHLDNVNCLRGVEEINGGTDRLGNECEEIYYCDKNDDTLTKDKQCAKRVPYKEITRESVTRCFNKLALMRPEGTSKESTTHTHSDNIFDALREELTKTAKGNIADETENLHPNVDMKEKTQVEVDQDDTDFEKEIIEMMRESFERKLSTTKEKDKDSTAKRILQSYSNPRPNLPTIREDQYHRNTNGQEIQNCFVTLGRKCDKIQQNEAKIEENIVESETQPQQDIEESYNARNEEKIGDKVSSGKADEYSDTPDCPDSPETVKYGDDSCSDMSGSDFQPYSSDESTDADSYDLNSEESTGESEKSISDDDQEKVRHKQKFSKVLTSHHKSVSRRKDKQKKSKNKKENKNRNKNSESETQLKQGVNVKRKHKKVRKHTQKKHTKVDTMLDVDEEKDGDKDGHDDTVTINSLVTTQRLYLDILQNSTGKADTQHAQTERNSDNLEDILSEGFMLKRDRDLSRLETEAERQREGTGSLADLERDDIRETIVNDPSTNCRYQVVEDEDGITLGGVVYYNEYILPFVYINGYKYTPLKDAATLFQPECCAWKCRIPKNVMTKNKQLFKTYSTWEQVYKLELIKMKKGPPIKTGDVLVKVDSFVSLLPSLLLDIIAQHKNSKLKYSQDCDMKSYRALQNRINLDLKKRPSALRVAMDNKKATREQQ